MRKASGKRLPHGETSTLVLATIWLLHLDSAHPAPVSRAQLIQALRLPETTIDDRLRVLVARGDVKKRSRGLYVPTAQKNRPKFDSYWRQRAEDRQKSELFPWRKVVRTEGADNASSETVTISAFNLFPDECVAPLNLSQEIETYLSPLHGKKLNPLICPNGKVILQIMISEDAYLAIESQRQEEAYSLLLAEDQT